MKIEVGKFYKTRVGDKVRIYATDSGGHFTIHGAMWVRDHWYPVAWVKNGCAFEDTPDQSYDLIAEWTDEPKEFDAWVKGDEILNGKADVRDTTAWKKVRVRIVE